MEVIIQVKKGAVYNDVAKLTGYVGVANGDYEGIATTDDDRLLLERFWRETINVVTGLFRRFIVSVDFPVNSQTVDDAEVFVLVVKLDGRFEEKLTPALVGSVFSYFVYAIAGKWFAVTCKGEVENFAELAKGYLDEVKGMLYFKRKPVRVVPG